MTSPMLAELDEVVRLKGYIKQSREHFDHAKSAALQFLINHHATLADMAKRLEAAKRDARMWRLCNSDHPFSDGTTVKCHVNVGVNIWKGDEWLEFHSCSPEQLEQVLQEDAIDAAAQEGEG